MDWTGKTALGTISKGALFFAFAFCILFVSFRLAYFIGYMDAKMDWNALLLGMGFYAAVYVGILTTSRDKRSTNHY